MAAHGVAQYAQGRARVRAAHAALLSGFEHQGQQEGQVVGHADQGRAHVEGHAVVVVAIEGRVVAVAVVANGLKLFREVVQAVGAAGNLGRTEDKIEAVVEAAANGAADAAVVGRLGMHGGEGRADPTDISIQRIVEVSGQGLPGRFRAAVEVEVAAKKYALRLRVREQPVAHPLCRQGAGGFIGLARGGLKMRHNDVKIARIAGLGGGFMVEAVHIDVAHAAGDGFVFEQCEFGAVVKKSVYNFGAGGIAHRRGLHQGIEHQGVDLKTVGVHLSGKHFVDAEQIGAQMRKNGAQAVVFDGKGQTIRVAVAHYIVMNEAYGVGRLGGQNLRADKEADQD